MIEKCNCLVCGKEIFFYRRKKRIIGIENTVPNNVKV